MEYDNRPFESIKIGLTSSESGKERFTRDGVFDGPPLSNWRNNLTALSQRFNLYFVATRDTIAVYRPDFPFQKLRRTASFVILPSLANPKAKGYLDTESPHAINHLIVDDLGKEEILLASTDSGNVTAYYTKNVEDAIRKHPYRFNFSKGGEPDYAEVRPFFAQWVRESAWGLAIHTNARMVAVSANTPHHTADDDPCAKITVFAFALTNDSDAQGQDEENDSDDEADRNENIRQSEWQEWVAMGVDASPPPRNKNYKITLAGVEGHDHNIPSISFVNTADDVEGNWLLSTDIYGTLKIWQIWQGLCQKSWDFDSADKRIRASFHRRREGGWLVAALDSRSFRTAKSMDQFCGHSKAPPYYGHSNLESFDLTHVVRLRTPGNSHAHPLVYAGTEDDDDFEDDGSCSETWSDLDEAIVEESQFRPILSSLPGHLHGFSENSPEPEPGTFDDLERQQHLEPSVLFPASGSTSQPAEVAGPSSARSAPPLAEPAPRQIVHIEHAVSDLGTSEEDDLEDLSDDDEDDDLSSTSRRSTTSLSSLAPRHSPEIAGNNQSPSDVHSLKPRTQNPGKKTMKMSLAGVDSSIIRAHGRASAPRIPTLHCTTSNLRLLMAPEADSPHIFCANILKQALPLAIESSIHAQIDRLNMIQQIPELGVVIIATQIGRCAICSLTKREQTDTFGLRVDWILPTKKQELKGLRPYSPLLGMAVSPVQGRFKHSSSSSSSISDKVSGFWGTDGVIDGIPTSFDQTVLVVDEGDAMDDDDQHFGGHKRKRKRLSPNSGKSLPFKTRTETRAWEIPTGADSWQAMDSSRRYRLMLTYRDMSVLTYELSRGIEKDDVAREEVISAFDFLD